MLLANVDGSVGGAQRQAKLLAREIAARGLPTVLLNQSSRLRARDRRRGEDGVNAVALPVIRRAPRASFFLSFLVWATMNRRRFAVIHAHSTAAGLTAGLVGRLIGKPVIVKVTGMQAVSALARGGPGWALRRYILDRTADALVAVSRDMMAALSMIGVARGRRVLIPNGVDLGPPAAPAPRAAKQEWLDGGDGAVVLYVGRLEEVKGVRRLLAMWKALPGRDTATLVLVGDGPLRDELEGETVAQGLDRSVRFLGTQTDVTPFYLIADLFVLPSASEGLSNALLEAMAARLPVIASDVGGNRDVIEDGVSGFLVNWDDPARVAPLVARLLDDAELRGRLGEAARRRASHFSIAAVAERYCALYHRLAAGDGAAGGRPGPAATEPSSRWWRTRAGGLGLSHANGRQ
jgi:glycosyltransferase involved in cell wall biosynthesis